MASPHSNNPDYLVIGANTWNITKWDLRKLASLPKGLSPDALPQYTLDQAVSSSLCAQSAVNSHSPHTNSPTSSDSAVVSDDLPPTVDSGRQQARHVIEICHENNIPAVAVSPCGNFAATCSIDTTHRIFDLTDGSMVVAGQIGQGGSDDWGWSTRWVGKHSVHIKTLRALREQANDKHEVAPRLADLQYARSRRAHSRARKSLNEPSKRQKVALSALDASAPTSSTRHSAAFAQHTASLAPLFNDSGLGGSDGCDAYMTLLASFSDSDDEDTDVSVADMSANARRTTRMQRLGRRQVRRDLESLLRSPLVQDEVDQVLSPPSSPEEPAAPDPPTARQSSARELVLRFLRERMARVSQDVGGAVRSQLLALLSAHDANPDEDLGILGDEEEEEEEEDPYYSASRWLGDVDDDDAAADSDSDHGWGDASEDDEDDAPLLLRAETASDVAGDEVAPEPDSSPPDSDHEPDQQTPGVAAAAPDAEPQGVSVVQHNGATSLATPAITSDAVCTCATVTRCGRSWAHYAYLDQYLLLTGSRYGLDVHSVAVQGRAEWLARSWRCACAKTCCSRCSISKLAPSCTSSGSSEEQEEKGGRGCCGPPAVLLTTLHRVHRATPHPCRYATSDRFIFCEYIPELSLILAASDGSDRVFLRRMFVASSLESWAVGEIPQNTRSGLPLRGVTMCAVRDGDEEDDVHDIVELPSCSASTLPGRIRYRCWRVYLLYADSRVCCCEIRATGT